MVVATSTVVCIMLYGVLRKYPGGPEGKKNAIKKCM